MRFIVNITIAILLLFFFHHCYDYYVLLPLSMLLAFLSLTIIKKNVCVISIISVCLLISMILMLGFYVYFFPCNILLVLLLLNCFVLGFFLLEKCRIFSILYSIKACQRLNYFILMPYSREKSRFPLPSYSSQNVPTAALIGLLISMIICNYQSAKTWSSKLNENCDQNAVLLMDDNLGGK